MPTPPVTTTPPAILAPAEQAEIDARLAAFYDPGAGPAVMSQAIPKFDAATGRQTHPNPFLARTGPGVTDPLRRAAGVKATPEYLASACSPDVVRHFRKSPCRSAVAPLADVTQDDLVDDLIDGWIDRGALSYDLSALPVTGTVAARPWSDDYWRTVWGGLAYRYSSGVEYKTYDAAVQAYAQPHEWLLSQGDPVAYLPQVIATWSPAEKYDLTAGDASFTLTNEQKGEGTAFVENGQVPDWEGLCDGWSAAAITTPRPELPVTLPGPQGVPVQWYPADVRALLTLAWAHGDYESNDIGGHCDETKVTTLPNGRVADQACFETDPATFHLALANLIGRVRQSFVMDASFDAEIWNQALVGYQLTYFNPLSPKQRSANWQDVAVPYDATFKARDRFQSPMTRGLLRNGAYDDRDIRKIVGVIATVEFDNEYTPVASPVDAADQTARVTYTYDLELSEADDGSLIPSGGEWQNNEHPNFLWIPRADTRLTLPATALQAASAAGAPLCSIVKTLVNRSVTPPLAGALPVCDGL